MKKFKKIFSKVLVSIMILTLAASSFPNEALAANTKIRQEINILSGEYITASGGSSSASSARINIDTTKYNDATYYFEVVASSTNSTDISADLYQIGGSAVASVNITGNTSSYTRFRSTSFTPTSGSNDYNFQVSSGDGRTGIIAARIIILQNTAVLTKTQTQIEIGNYESFSSTATTSLASPKYWYYDSTKWDGNPTFYAEATYSTDVVNQTYDTWGAKSWVANTTGNVTVQAWGAGGAGGGMNLSSDGGGGGGGGAFGQKHTFAVTKGTTYYAYVGKGGVGVASGTGGTGQNSSFGASSGTASSTLLACGGVGGAPSTGTPPAGGLGGTTACGLGDLEYAGGQGEKGENASQGQGGYGGSSGGTAAIGYSGPQTWATEFYPTGSTPSGAGHGGNGGALNTNGSAPASGNGGGGGGSGEGTAKVGGSGADGKVVIATSSLAYISVQEDNGSFGGWTDKATIVYEGSASTATRVRSSAFTPTTGRNYRLAYRSSTGATLGYIYNAKIVVDQGASTLNDFYNINNRDSDYPMYTGSNAEIAQTFISTGGTLTSIQFEMRKTGSPTGNMVAKIYSHTGTFGSTGTPTGAALATSDAIDVSTLVALHSTQTFTFSGANSISLSASTNYVVSVEYSGGNISNSVDVGADASSPSHSGNAVTYNGSTWSAVASVDVPFYVYTSDSPTKLEPQYLVSNTKLAAGTSLQNYRTYWDPAEWATDTSLSYYHEANGQAAGTSDVKLQQRPANTDITNSAITDLIQRERSAALTMPGAATDLDVIATTNNSDIYSSRIIVQVDATPLPTTTVGDGTDPANKTIGPGDAATSTDAFTLITNTGTDTVTGLTVTLLPSGSYVNIDTVTITNAQGVSRCSASPSGDNTVEITGCSIAVSTTATSSLIMLTPKAHGSMPAVPGASYDVTATTTSITATNAKTYSDTDSATVTIDNASPSDPSGQTGTAGDTEVALSWVQPGDGDFLQMVILASTSAITTNPVEGSTYIVGNTISGARVACVSASTSCTDTGLTNGTPYYYKFFSKDTRGNYSAGINIIGTTKTPVATTYNQSAYRIFASSTPDGTTWTSRTAPSSRDRYAVTYGNGIFVAVSGTSDGNRVSTSPDGITWTDRSVPQSNTWVSVTYGNGMFVAVSVDGTNRVMTSPDGINWTVRSAAAARAWRSVTYGNGKFVAVASDTSTNGVMTSLDGITWTEQTSSQTFAKWGVTYGNGLYVVAGGGANGAAANQIMTSPDGETWNTQTAPSGAWFAGAYGNGTYVVVGVGGAVITSTNGTSWDSQTSSSVQTFRGVIYGNGLFVAVADTGSSPEKVMTSTDGVSWADGSGPSQGLNSVAYGNGMFVITTSSSAAIWTSGSPLGMPLATYNSAATLAATNDTFKLRQVLTTTGTSAGVDKLFKLQYAEKSGTCDISFTGEIYRDITQDTPISFAAEFLKLDNHYPVVSTTTDPFSDGGNQKMQKYESNDLFSNYVAMNANDDNTWEFTLEDNGATGGTSYCIRAIKTATSTSATTWTSRTSLVANAWSDIAYGNGLFVAIASNGTTANGIMTSPDGITWTSRTTPTANNWASVTYGNGLFVAVAYNGTTADDVMRSSDGITWTSDSLNGVPTANTWQSVTYGNGLFVAIGNGGTTANDVMTSPDGITWTPRTIPAAIGWLSVTYGNGLFVAIAWNGTTANNIMTSPDGITWTSRTSPVVNQWQDATYGNGLFVTVASYSGADQRVMTSPDGVTWTSRTSAANNDWLGVTYGNGLFVAVATDLYGTAGAQIMTSPDGVTWTSRTSAAANQWQSVTYGNGLFVAVAADGTTADDIMTASTTDTLLDTYTYIPEVTTAVQAATLSQLHYRWRNDYGTESGAGYMASEDTAITSGVEIGDRVRLRFLIKDTAGSASNYVYRLEVASSSCSTWIAMPTSSSSGAPHWIMDTTSRVADGSATTDSAGLTNPTGTFTAGYFTSQSNSSPSLSLTSGQFTELEYSLRSTQNISLGTVYCFRLTNAGVATGFTYSHQPQITVLARNGVSRQSGGSGNAGNEANGTGPIIPGGGAGGGGGTETGGGGQGTGGGGSGGGGGGDTGYLLLPRFFQLAKNLFIITNDEFSFGYILKLR